MQNKKWKIQLSQVGKAQFILIAWLGILLMGIPIICFADGNQMEVAVDIEYYGSANVSILWNIQQPIDPSVKHFSLFFKHPNKHNHIYISDFYVTDEDGILFEEIDAETAAKEKNLKDKFYREDTEEGIWLRWTPSKKGVGEYLICYRIESLLRDYDDYYGFENFSFIGAQRELPFDEVNMSVIHEKESSTWEDAQLNDLVVEVSNPDAVVQVDDDIGELFISKKNLREQEALRLTMKYPGGYYYKPDNSPRNSYSDDNTQYQKEEMDKRRQQSREIERQRSNNRKYYRLYARFIVLALMFFFGFGGELTRDHLPSDWYHLKRRNEITRDNWRDYE